MTESFYSCKQIENLFRESIREVSQDGTLSIEKRNELYNAVFRYFHGPEFEDLLLKSCSVSAKTKELKPEDLVSGKLYFQFREIMDNFINEQIAHLNEKSNDEFLHFAQKSMKTYLSLVKIFAGALKSVDQGFLLTVPAVLSQHFLPVETLCLLRFDQRYLNQIESSVHQWAFRVIDENRRTNQFDVSAVANVFQQFVQCDGQFSKVDPAILGRESKHFYEEKFIEAFWNSTKEFYTAEAEQSLKYTSVVALLEKIEICLHREEKIYSGIFKEAIKNMLISRFQTFLQELKAVSIDDAAQELITKEISSSFSKLLKFLHDRPDKLAHFINMFKNHMNTTFLNKLNEIPPSNFEDVELYIETFTEMIDRFSNFLENGFQLGKEAKCAFDQTVNSLLSGNPLTKKLNCATLSWNYLAKYVDNILNPKTIFYEEAVLEKKIDQFLKIFYFISDKDRFDELLGPILAQRMMTRAVSTEQRAIWLFVKLRKVHVSQLMRKFERMIEDLQTNEKFSNSYQDVFGLNNKNSMEVTVSSFRDFIWQFPPKPQIPIKLPIELEKVMSDLQTIEESFRQNTNLRLIHSMSDGVVTYSNKNRTYNLHVNTYHIIVLFLFNDSLVWKVEDIMSRTGIELVPLTQVLRIFLLHKIFSCDEIPHINQDFHEEKIKKNHHFRLNDDFYSEALEIDLLTPIRFYQRQDSQIVDERNRTYHIELIKAAIVRIMKVKNTWDMDSLTTELKNKFSDRFTLEPSMIKESIDWLDNKGYLSTQVNTINNGILLEYLP